MATRSQVEQFAAAQRGLSVLARRRLAAWWRTVDPADGLAVRRGLEVFLPDLVGAFGDQSASLAADFYEGLRVGAGIAGPFEATLADPIPADQVRARGRWALSPLFGGSGPVAALALLAGVTDEMVKQSGRDTIARSAARDGARWARVPVGDTCAWCLMLASRGAVYESEQSAGERRSFHGDCNCTPTPVWDDRDLPDGYDPAALEAQYLAAREAASSGRPKTILSELRSQQDSN